MEYKMEPVKGQRFEIGRTINPFRCSECKQQMGSCDFLNCPLKNYAVRMRQSKYSLKDWYEENKDKLVKGCIEDYDVLSSLLEDVCRRFPKGSYWNTSGYPKCNAVKIVTLASKTERRFHGEDFTERCGVDLHYGNSVNDYSATDAQLALAKNISKNLQELKKMWEKDNG